MDKAHAMDKLEPVTEPLGNRLDLRLLKPTLTLKPSKDRPLTRILKHNIESLLIMEEPIEVDDIETTELVMDTKLFGQLPLHTLLSGCLLADYFEGTDETGCLVSA